MKRLWLPLFLLAATPALACIQSYATTLQGKRIQVNGLAISSLDLVKNFADRDAAFWKAEQKKLLAQPRTQQTRNDYAVTLLHLGQTAEAIEILRGIEQSHPGIYATAANLGTAFELAGNNDDALRWIRESIRRNAKAHEGTEWVHVAILEAKIARRLDPAWLDSHSVLRADFGSEGKPRKPAHLPKNNAGREVTAKEFEAAIFYQLMERLQFVKPYDAFVADVLFDWGNSVALTGTVEDALNLYRQSLRFAPGREALVKRRMAFMSSVIRKAERS